MINITHQTKLYCPDSEIDDYMMALHVNFWLDEGDVWNVICEVCGGEHCLGEMLQND